MREKLSPREGKEEKKEWTRRGGAEEKKER